MSGRFLAAFRRKRMAAPWDAAASDGAAGPVRPRTRDRHGGARWFAAEFLVVVTGVLVALALNAWWQGRTDVAREQAYLRQLLEDFRANEQEIELFTRRELEVSASADRFYRAAHLPLAPADSLRRWLEGSLYLPRLRLRMATWEALIQSGEIRLIRSDGLRNRLIEFAGAMDNVEGRVEKLTHIGFDEIRSVYRWVDPYEFADESGRDARGWDDLESRFPPAWEDLLADLEFVSVVYTTGLAAWGRSLEVGSLLEPIRDIMGLLEEELPR